MQHHHLNNILAGHTRVYIGITTNHGPISSMSLIVCGSKIKTDDPFNKAVEVNSIYRGKADITFKKVEITAAGVKDTIIEQRSCKISDLSKWLVYEQDIVFIGSLSFRQMAILTEMISLSLDVDHPVANIHDAKFMDSDFLDYTKLRSPVWKGTEISKQLPVWDQTMYTMLTVESFLVR